MFSHAAAAAYAGGAFSYVYRAGELGLPAAAPLRPGGEPVRIYIPVADGFAGGSARFDLRPSPELPGDARVIVDINGRDVAQESISELRRTHALTLRFLSSRENALVFDVRLADGAQCRALPLGRVVLAGDSEIVLRQHHVPTVASVLTPYAPRFNVVDRTGGNSAAVQEILRTAYVLRRATQWHQADVRYGTAPAPGANTIIFESRGDRMRVDRRTLHVPLGALRAYDAALVETFASSAARAQPSAHSITLAALGYGGREMYVRNVQAFTIPFALSQMGGIPRGTFLDTQLRHDAIPSGASAEIAVLLNGTVVDRRRLATSGGVERFASPVRPQAWRAENVLTYEVRYTDAKPCPVQKLAVQIDGSSDLQWRGIENRTPQAGSFFGIAHGRLDVGMPGVQDLPLAFSLMANLGESNPAISAIDYNGAAAAHDDAALELLPQGRMQTVLGGDVSGAPVAQALLEERANPQLVPPGSIAFQKELKRTALFFFPLLILGTTIATLLAKKAS
jgi:hypothetical protein